MAVSVQDVIYTSNPIRDYEFSWTIENFSLTHDVLQGPSFAPIPGFPEKLCLKLQFKQLWDGSTDKSSLHHFASLDLILEDLNAKTSKCSRVTFLGSTTFNNVDDKILQGSCPWNIPACTNFKEKFILLNYTSEKRFSSDLVSKPNISKNFLKLMEDKLVVKGKLTFSGYGTVTSISSSEAKYNSETYEELVKALKTVFESGSSSDITFSVGEKTLRAHKFILLSRSPVFAKMFDSDMLESNSNEVVIEDADFHAFNCFLMFLYTGMVQDKKWNTVLSLYSLAHKYQVKSLLAICSRILGNSLSIDSACSVLVLSDLHGDKALKNVTKVFIRLHLVQIVVTTDWVDLVTSKPLLVKAVMA